jgi:hypothetical protein
MILYWLQDSNDVIPDNILLKGKKLDILQVEWNKIPTLENFRIPKTLSCFFIY